MPMRAYELLPRAKQLAGNRGQHCSGDPPTAVHDASSEASAVPAGGRSREHDRRLSRARHAELGQVGMAGADGLARVKAVPPTAFELNSVGEDD